MFGKKKDTPDKEAASPAANMGSIGPLDDISTPPLKPFSRKGSHAPLKPPSPTSFLPSPPRRPPPDIPGMTQVRHDRAAAFDLEPNQLLVGRDICISGEITACDKLVVEGRAEVQLPDTRFLDVAPSGLFKGAATVEVADISGRFEGELTVLEKLTVRPGGKLSGTIRYAQIIIEPGGEVSGDMQTLETPEAEKE